MNLQVPHRKKTSGQSGPDGPCGSHLRRAFAVAAMAVAVAISFSACGKTNEKPGANAAEKAASWAPREFTDVSLESPAALAPEAGAMSTLSPGTFVTMEYFERFATGDDANPSITLTRSRRKPGMSPNVESAMKAGMNAAIGFLTQASGQTDFPFSSTSLMIDGADARKASYTGQAQGTSVHIDAIFATSGQKMWQVAVISSGDSFAADVARILNSVHFKADTEAASWKTRDVTGMTLESPYALNPDPDLVSDVQAQTRATMEHLESFYTGDTNPAIAIIEMEVKPGITMSLDGEINGAMNGAIANMKKAPGETNPPFSSSSLLIDGLPARKASFTGQSEGKTVHLDAVAIQKGQKTWQVSVITTGDSSSADVTRILNSVHIKADTGQ